MESNVSSPSRTRRGESAPCWGSITGLNLNGVKKMLRCLTPERDWQGSILGDNYNCSHSKVSI